MFEIFFKLADGLSWLLKLVLLLFVLSCVLFSFLPVLALDLVAWAIAFLIAAFRSDREEIRAAVRANSGDYRLAWVSCSGWLLVLDLWDSLVGGAFGTRFRQLVDYLNGELIQVSAIFGGAAIVYSALCYWSAIPWDGVSMVWFIMTGFLIAYLVMINFGRLLDIAKGNDG